MRKISPQIYSRPVLKCSRTQASQSPNLSPEKSQSKIQRKNFKQLVLPKIKICEIGHKSQSQTKHKRNKTNQSIQNTHKKSIVQIGNEAVDQGSYAFKSFDDIMIKQQMQRFERIGRLSIVKRRRIQPYMKFSHNQSKLAKRKKIKVLKKQIEQQKKGQNIQKFCSQVIDQRKQRQKIQFKPRLWTKKQQLKQLKAKLQQFLKAKSSTHLIRNQTNL